LSDGNESNIEKLFDAKLQVVHTKLDTVIAGFNRIEKKIKEETITPAECEKRVLRLQYYILAVFFYVSLLCGIDLLNIKLPIIGG